MKFIVVAFALLIVAVTARHEEEYGDGGIVTNRIARGIDHIKQRIVNAGLDPLVVQNYTVAKISRLGNSHVWVKDLQVHGLSNIVVETLTFDETTSQLKTSLVLPKISFSVESMGLEIDLIGHKLSAEVSGSVEVVGVRIIANHQLNMNYNNGVTVQRCEMDLDLHSVKSRLQVRVQGRDLSERINRAFGVTVPKKLRSKKVTFYQMNENVYCLGDTISVGECIETFMQAVLHRHSTLSMGSCQLRPARYWTKYYEY